MKGETSPLNHVEGSGFGGKGHLIAFLKVTKHFDITITQGDQTSRFPRDSLGFKVYVLVSRTSPLGCTLFPDLMQTVPAGLLPMHMLSKQLLGTRLKQLMKMKCSVIRLNQFVMTESLFIIKYATEEVLHVWNEFSIETGKRWIEVFLAF